MDFHVSVEMMPLVRCCLGSVLAPAGSSLVDVRWRLNGCMDEDDATYLPRLMSEAVFTADNTMCTPDGPRAPGTAAGLRSLDLEVVRYLYPSGLAELLSAVACASGDTLRRLRVRCGLRSLPWFLNEYDWAHQYHRQALRMDDRGHRRRFHVLETLELHVTDNRRLRDVVEHHVTQGLLLGSSAPVRIVWSS